MNFFFLENVLLPFLKYGRSTHNVEGVVGMMLKKRDARKERKKLNLLEEVLKLDSNEKNNN